MVNCWLITCVYHLQCLIFGSWTKITCFYVYQGLDSSKKGRDQPFPPKIIWSQLARVLHVLSKVFPSWNALVLAMFRPEFVFPWFLRQAFRDLALLHHPDKGLESCNETFLVLPCWFDWNAGGSQLFWLEFGFEEDFGAFPYWEVHVFAFLKMLCWVSNEFFILLECEFLSLRWDSLI